MRMIPTMLYATVCEVHRFLPRLLLKKKLRQKNFEGLVQLLKMVFKCRIAWCALSMDRAIVHCQRYVLGKKKGHFESNATVFE